MTNIGDCMYSIISILKPHYILLGLSNENKLFSHSMCFVIGHDL